MPARGTHGRALSFKLCGLAPPFLRHSGGMSSRGPWQLQMTWNSSSNFFTSEEPFTAYEGLSQPSHWGSQKPTKNERPWQRRKPSFWERGLSPRLEVQGSFCFPLIVLFQQVPEQQDGQVKSHCPCHLSQKGGTGLEVKNPATHRLILSNTTRLKWNRFLATLLPVTPSSLIPSLTCHAPLDSLRNRTKKRFFLPPSLHQWLN